MADEEKKDSTEDSTPEKKTARSSRSGSTRSKKTTAAKKSTTPKADADADAKGVPAEGAGTRGTSTRRSAAKAKAEAEKAPEASETVSEADKTVKKTPKKADVVKSEAKAADSVSAPAKTPASLKLPLVIVIGVAALVCGLLLGRFVLSGLTFGNSVAGKTTIAESDLDSAIATYTYGGQTYSITAREAIEVSSSVDSAKQDDGTYTMPSADSVLSVARNDILAKEVDAKGITVSDDDVDSYAQSYLGSNDYSTIASEYSMSEDQVKAILKRSCGVKKLYDTIVTTSTATAPTEPTAPADGQEDVATADYGAYIIGLLGDEWDSTNNTWARTDGPYYAALSSETFSADSATYSQAETAYYVAYQQYSESSSTSSSQWTSYVNGLLSNASIQINSLVS